MKTILALFGVAGIVAMSYGAGAMKYTCVSPAYQAIADGSGRWFYVCTGPEPTPSQRASLGEAMDRIGAGLPTARVSLPQAMAR